MSQERRVGLSTGKFSVDEIGFMQMATSRVLAAVAHGELDLNLLARQELAQRGQDAAGNWVGFRRAAEIFHLHETVVANA